MSRCLEIRAPFRLDPARSKIDVLDAAVTEAVQFLPMQIRGLVALVVLGLVVVLRPMAFADPPDQGWLGGFFDDADYDNVVMLITEATPATIALHVGYDPSPGPFVVMPVVESAPTPVPAPIRSGNQTRAPPAL